MRLCYTCLYEVKVVYRLYYILPCIRGMPFKGWSYTHLYDREVVKGLSCTVL